MNPSSVFRTRRVAFAALAFAAFALAPLSARAQPPPTLVNDRQDETDLDARRRAWIDDLHRVAPGTDWRAIEDANRLETLFLRQSGGVPAQVTTAPGWSDLGAANQTGRNYDCALGSDGLLYVGSANGGLFGGPATGGSTWTPLTDNLGYGVEHVLALGGPPIQFVIASNTRLFYSHDGGATWAVPGGLPDYIYTVVRLVREADNTTTVYALVEGWIWTGSAWDHNWDLLRSTDGGASYARTFAVPIATRPDMWISRTAAGPLYLAYGNQLFKSTDHGATFASVGTLPATGDQVRLAGSEAGAPAFYCALHSGGAWTLYSSTNASLAWTNRGALTDFWGSILAPVSDAAQVFIGGVNCYRSTDGGATRPAINVWSDYYGNPQHKLHADIDGLTSTVAPGGGNERIYIHTDGGTYLLTPTTTIPDNITRNGFRNAQYYGTLTSLTDPTRLSAGAQDQGFQISAPLSGVSAPNFSQAISGDYAHLVSSWPDRSRLVFAVYPAFVEVQTGPGEAPALESTSFPPGQPGFKFLPATSPDPANSSAAYVCARQIWHVVRNAANSYSWTALSHDFDHGDGDVVGALAITPTRWYAASYGGRIYYSTDSGANWTESAVIGPSAHYFAGSGLAVSPTDPMTAWVCGSGYSNPGVYKTTDGGATWVPFSIGLPRTMVYAIALESSAAQRPYIATQAGPLRWSGTAWENLLVTTCCAPVTDYWGVESLPAQSIMRFSTYGRGIWDYAIGSFTSVPVTDGPSLSLSVTPNPATGRSRLVLGLAQAGLVRVQVFDVLGRHLRTLVDGWRPAGAQRVLFDHTNDAGAELPAGLYVVRMESPQGVAVARLAITR